MDRQPNTIYVLALSYGKDSIATLEACRQLNYPVDVVVHSEIWFNDEISADLPPMLEFKKYADKVIKERYGLDVLHICATKKPVAGGVSPQEQESSKLTYCDLFYKRYKHSKNSRFGDGGVLSPNQNSVEVSEQMQGSNSEQTLRESQIGDSRYKRETGAPDLRPNLYGFPHHATRKSGSAWCKRLKQDVKLPFSDKPASTTGKKTNIVQYLGIAADEPERIERHIKRKDIILPLVDIGWDEAYCRKWCEKNNLLSPIYTTATRGGCWFCQNQPVGQLRLLRKNYPELWAQLLRLDVDSPTTFHANGHTVHDFDRRFQMEDDALIPSDKPFRWKMLEKDEQTA